MFYLEITNKIYCKNPNKNVNFNVYQAELKTYFSLFKQ